MAGEESVDTAVIQTRLASEHLEELNHPTAAPPCAGENRHAHLVRFTLLVPIESQEDATGKPAGGGLRRAGTAAVSEQSAQQSKPHFATIPCVSLSAP
jgi:hypothetical protein